MHAKRHARGLKLAAIALAALVLAGCADKPQEKTATMRIYCGGSMRKPTEKLIAEFEKKHNVKIEAMYSGCGILVGQMKAGATGDVYYSCDSSFFDDAKSIGAIDTDEPMPVVTRFRPVIMVPKGNPQNIQTVGDLARPEIKKIGVGREDAGAVGRTGWRLLRESAKWPEMKQQIDAGTKQLVEGPTADFIGTQMATGHLDAALLWDVVAQFYGDSTDMIYVEGEVASQSIGVMKGSEHPELARKFVEFMNSDHAREVFHAHGFIVDNPAEQPSE